MTMKMIASGVAVLGLAIGASAADQKVPRKDLPPAVQKAVQQEETKGATIAGLSKEVEGGKTMYEVETMVNGHSRDLLFSAAGTLVETEEAIEMSAAPAAVRTALDARGKVLKVELVTKGKIVTYEANVKKNGKTTEVAVNADGKPIKP